VPPSPGHSYSHAAIAIGAEVLRRVEAETADRAEVAGTFAAVFGADGLGGVLDNRHAMPLAVCQIGSISAVCPNRWTTMMARVRGVTRDAISTGSTLQVTGSISTKLGGPKAADGADRREKRERRHDDLIAVADSQGTKGQEQSIGADEQPTPWPVPQ